MVQVIIQKYQHINIYTSTYSTSNKHPDATYRSYIYYINPHIQPS